MSTHHASGRRVLFLFTLLILVALLRPGLARPTSDIANSEALALRDPGMSPATTVTRPKPKNCEQKKTCADEDQDGEELPDTDYEVDQFDGAPEKKAKVEAQKKKIPNPDSPNLCQVPCDGECCDKKTEHCAWMKRRHQRAPAYSTCCPLGQKADRNGKCCNKANIMSDNLCH